MHRPGLGRAPGCLQRWQVEHNLCKIIRLRFKLCIKRGWLMPLQQPPGKSHHSWLIRAKETQGSYSLVGRQPSLAWQLCSFWSKPGVWATRTGFMWFWPWEFFINTQINHKGVWISRFIFFYSLYWMLCPIVFNSCCPYWTLHKYQLRHAYGLNFFLSSAYLRHP